MKILLVEDDESISKVLKNGLETELFAVDVATDGEEGSSMARSNDYDLIILDVSLPKKNGQEVLADIRAKGKTVPVLILSIESETDLKVKLLDGGADDYLNKPFSFKELMARIRALLRRPNKIEAEVLSVDDLKLNTKTHVVARGGKEIHLTRKEFMLLELLMHYKGDVLSRGMINEHVWDNEADPFSKTIESHILSLRRKISINGKNKLIETVSGRGYKI